MTGILRGRLITTRWVASFSAACSSAGASWSLRISEHRGLPFRLIVIGHFANA